MLRPSKPREKGRIVRRPKGSRSKYAISLPPPELPRRGSGHVLVLGNNDFGQLGLAISEDDDSDDDKEIITPTLNSILDKMSVIDMSSGNLHCAALTHDGRVVTWGCNDHGSLGRRTASNEEMAIPAYAEGIEGVEITKIVCGGSISLAISSDGYLYMAGTFKGQSGVLGFKVKEKTPTQQMTFVLYEPAKELVVVDAAAGTDHAVVLTTEGYVYCWGSGEAGQLARKVSERHATSGLYPNKLNLIGIEKVFSGAFHSFAVQQDGTVYAWGLNNFGQCGFTSKDVFIMQPTIVEFFNDKRVKIIAAGEHHTLALLEDGRVFSFGRADYGQLGLGELRQRNIPIPTLISVSAGKVDRSEDAMEIDDPMEVESGRPSKSRNPLLCRLITTGDHHSVVVGKDGFLYTFGFGDSGALGNKGKKPGEEDDDEEFDEHAPFRVMSKEFENREIQTSGQQLRFRSVMTRNFVNVTVSDDGLTVTNTDGDASRWPNITQVLNPSGELVYFRSGDNKRVLYLTKLGESLAKVLRRSGIDVTKPVLTSLPDGYGLFERVKENKNHVEVRTDTYLFGSNVNSKFCSPHEFEEHLLWLASDGAPPCRCKYCQKNQSRRQVSRASPKKESSSKRLTDLNTESTQDAVKPKKPKISSNDPLSSGPEALNGRDRNLEKHPHVFRIGEIVWADVRHVLTESQKNESGSRITYWPAFIRDHCQDKSVLAGESPEVAVQYNLRIFLFGDNVLLKQKSILPWLEIVPEEVTAEMKDIEHTELMSKFLQAVDHAKAMASSTLEPYYSDERLQPFRETDGGETKKGHKLNPCIRIKGLLYGAELLKENDYVRVYLDQSQSTEDMNKNPIFKIHHIYYNESTRRIELSGDIYIRMFQEKHVLVRINPNKEEYRLGLSEVAGRFYEIFPNITRSLHIDEFWNERHQNEIFKEIFDGEEN
ncbi:15822_t:CDS:2 [Acaulospora colombiana]|uniref:15822_t:CDS:1 n=1 Tax=Acaulospora colombiana TaxID=27376 RepID=A0ACA9KDB1_9GLOM|nr:15822_t:CDS:2 [Acaulospora colombiana]